MRQEKEVLLAGFGTKGAENFGQIAVLTFSKDGVETQYFNNDGTPGFQKPKISWESYFDDLNKQIERAKKYQENLA